MRQQYRQHRHSVRRSQRHAAVLRENYTLNARKLQGWEERKMSILMAISHAFTITQSKQAPKAKGKANPMPCRAVLHRCLFRPRHP